MSDAHVPHPHIGRRKSQGPALIAKEHVGFNGWLAVTITKIVGSMWCAYAFGALALISLPQAIHDGTFALVSWISQTFLQLVLLSVIMVGQQVLAKASDKQAQQTFEDTEAVLQLTDEIHRLIKVNNQLTDEIHRAVTPTAAAR
jgi:DNA integrity scanning protein DisA with diadenylate cyclase activity